jgi:hypothetical protein
MVYGFRNYLKSFKLQAQEPNNHFMVYGSWFMETSLWELDACGWGVGLKKIVCDLPED